MNDEELQRRLRRIDPAVGASIEPPTGHRAAVLMEQIMNHPTLTSSPLTSAPRPTRRWSRFVLAGAAALALGGVGAVALGAFDADDDSSSVTYAVGAPDSMAMCLPVTDYVPDPALVGFKGVVTAVGDGTVTIDVGKWFAGGEADQVVLDTTEVGIPALDGVEFVQGGEFLVTVLDGQVLTCGLSGPADPVLEGLYDGWFAG